MPRPALFGAALVALAGLLWPIAPGAAHPQEPSKPDEPTGEPASGPFLERVDVEIVNLDVVVTDRRGEPVTGLTRDDFVLSVDGEPTPIDNFYVVEPEPPADAVAPPAVEPAAPAEPAGAAEPAPPAEPPADQALHLVLLFDNRRATIGDRKKVTRDLSAALEDGLEGRGRASVAYYDRGIKVQQPFTSDGAALAAAIREMGKAGAVAYSEDFELRTLVRELEEGRVGVAEIEAWAERQVSVTRRTLEALTAQVDALAGLPGRKMLLFVSSGLDLRPGEALMAALRNKAGDAIEVQGARNTVLPHMTGDLTDRLRELTRRANAGRVALYTVGTKGAGFNPMLDPSHHPGVGGRAWDPGTETRFRADFAAGLETMAAVTGGEALTNSDNYDLIAERIERDAGHGYSLGFRAPDGGEPGKSYRVRVEVPGRGRLRVRHRENFVIATPAERAAERTLAALLFGHADNALGIAPEFGAPQPSEEGRNLVVLPVLVKVPFANLTLLPEGAEHRGTITILVVAEDEQGRLSDVQTVEAAIEIPGDRLEAALAGVAGHRLGLLVRPGPHRLGIGVRDEVGNVVSTVVIDYLVSEPKKEQAASARPPASVD